MVADHTILNVTKCILILICIHNHLKMIWLISHLYYDHFRHKLAIIVNIYQDNNLSIKKLLCTCVNLSLKKQFLLSSDKYELIVNKYLFCEDLSTGSINLFNVMKIVYASECERDIQLHSMHFS